MSDWSTAWSGAREGLAHGASLAEQRRARQAQEEFERQRVGYEGERLGLEKSRAQREAEAADIAKKIAEERFKRMVTRPDTSGTVVTGIEETPEGPKVIRGFDPRQVISTPIPGMPYHRAVTMGDKTTIVQGSPALEFVADQLKGQSQAPDVRRPVGLFDVLAPKAGESAPPFFTPPQAPPVRKNVDVSAPTWPSSGPSITGVRPAATSTGVEFTTSGLTEEQENELLEDPSLANRVPSPYREAAQRVVKEHSDNLAELQKIAERSSNIAVYLGAGETPGINQIRNQLNALMARHRGPSGVIDFSQVTPMEAFSTLFSASKVNDPKAVMTQAEMEQAEKNFGIPATISNIFNQWKTGQKIPPSRIEDIYNVVNTKANEAQTALFNSLSNLEKMAEKRKVKLNEIIPDPTVLTHYSAWKNLPKIDSKAQFEQLPIGTQYRDSSGKIGTKK